MELLQTLVPPMAERGWGRVVTIGSVQQTAASRDIRLYRDPGRTTELGPEPGAPVRRPGRDVNNLAPGTILTARDRDQIAVKGEALAQRVPAGHWRPDDPLGLQCCCAPMPAAG